MNMQCLIKLFVLRDQVIKHSLGASRIDVIKWKTIWKRVVQSSMCSVLEINQNQFIA